jgi:phosphoglucomutase
MNYMDRYAFWCNANLPEAVLAELEEIKNNEEELKSRFSSDLQFGTAGMRGIMGMGSNRLNVYTVRRAAQGMAAWLSGTELPKLAAIGYDSRHHSEEFANVCAVAFAEAGIKTYLYDRLAPTPMLSFAVRELGCGCGIVISASHNAGEYNGVKCYGPDGCQMTDAPAAIVTETIAKIPYFVPEAKSFAEFMQEGLIEYIGQPLWEKYYETVLSEAVAPELIKKSGLNIVYTPLCGTGNEPVREVLGRLGVNITVVACQEKPDGDFKTCEYPNPETDAALNESYKVADTVPCDVILGTDPDCDRVAIAVRDEKGEFVLLNGNQTCALLTSYMLTGWAEKGKLTGKEFVVKTIVTSEMIPAVAASYGVKSYDCLTGFKYIAKIIREKEGVEQYIGGGEESFGFLAGDFVRDKDAVSACSLAAEAAAWAKTKGLSLYSWLKQMYVKFGFYKEGLVNVVRKGKEGQEEIARMMSD